MKLFSHLINFFVYSLIIVFSQTSRQRFNLRPGTMVMSDWLMTLYNCYSDLNQFPELLFIMRSKDLPY